MHVPRTSHPNLVKHIIRYIKGTLDLALTLSHIPLPPLSLTLTLIGLVAPIRVILLWVSMYSLEIILFRGPPNAN
jgi:hypothetical protein